MTEIQPKPRGYFITGTDTGVGKTFVACALASKLVDAGEKVGVMKPVETGCARKDGALFPADAATLRLHAACGDPLDVINPYRFEEALAPSIAARQGDVKISLYRIRKAFDEMTAGKTAVVVEGAGGLMCPVTDDKTMTDVALMLGLPVIIVAASRLGAINHALLTAAHATSVGLEVKGVVLNETSQKACESSRYNADEIRRFLSVPVLAEIPFSKDPKEAGRLYFKSAF